MATTREACSMSPTDGNHERMKAEPFCVYCNAQLGDVYRGPLVAEPVKVTSDGRWTYDDGGRAAAGYKGDAGDCVTRAIAIATRRPYQEIYDMVNAEAQTERAGARRGRRSSARTGVFKPTTKRIMEKLGWKWTPTMHVGQGCKTHLRASELPKGHLVVSVSKHLVAVIDGVIHDTQDPSREGTRCVYGYWTAE